jgi:hypothetical protein
MFGVSKKAWWLGLLVARVAIEIVACTTAIVVIASAVIHATSTGPRTLQEEQRLTPPPSFQERWQSAFSTDWKRHLTAVPIRVSH